MLSFEKLNWTKILFTLFAELKQQKLRCACICALVLSSTVKVYSEYILPFQSFSYLLVVRLAFAKYDNQIQYNHIQERLNSLKTKPLYSIQLNNTVTIVPTYFIFFFVYYLLICKGSAIYRIIHRHTSKRSCGSL